MTRARAVSLVGITLTKVNRKKHFPPYTPLGLDLRFDTTIRRITEGEIQMTAAFHDRVFYDCDFSSERTGAKEKTP